jgi:hypothetical protein
MALIGAYDSDSNRNPTFAEWQRYLAYLETLVDGEPGRPRATPEPFEPVEAFELVDGPVVAPPPEKPKRRRRAVKPRDLEPRGNTDLARYARKLKGEP